MKRLITAAALLLTLTACGSDEEPAADPDKPFNQADVAFATEMIPHHAEALSMVDLTLERDVSPELEALTEQIRAAQAPEIELMVDWLEEWDEPVPETMRDHANAHGDGGHTDGMVDLDELEDASDAEFEDLWLEAMIEHHEGAIEMAVTEVEEGRHDTAIALARSIASSQQDEIDQMELLLAE